MDNKYSKLANNILGRESNSNQYSNFNDPSCYIKSRSVKKGLEKIFNSRESAEFYMLSGESLLDAIDIQEFAVENFFNDLMNSIKTDKVLSKVMGSKEYKKIGTESQEILKNLKYKNDKSLEAMGSMIKNIGITLKNIIKRVILAIANFFKGIFIRIKTLFSKKSAGKTEDLLGLYNSAMSQLNNDRNAALIKMRVKHIRVYNPNFKRYVDSSLRITSRGIDELNTGYNILQRIIKNKDAATVDNIMRTGKFKAHSVIEGIPNNNLRTYHSLLEMLIPGSQSATIQQKVNMIAYGTANPIEGYVTAKAYLEAVKKSGILSMNVDQVLNQTSNNLLQANSILTKINSDLDLVYMDSGVSEDTVRRDTFRISQSKTLVTLCIRKTKEILQIYNIVSGAMVKIGAETRSACKKLLSADAMAGATKKKLGRSPLRRLFAKKSTILNE